MLIVGLGNPPELYGKTRHNAGFWLVDEWVRRLGKSWQLEKKFQAHCVKYEGHVFLKSTHFMNLSGQSIQKIMAYYQIPVSDLVVAYDEMSFSAGVARFKQGGGAAGHNGVKDIISRIGDQFIRVRIGVGRPAPGHDVSHFVLSPPSRSEKALIDQAIQALVDDAEMILNKDFAKLMNHWNQ